MNMRTVLGAISRPFRFALFLGAAFALPVALTWVTSRGLEGYYETDRICGCGHSVYEVINETGTYQFIPGHHELIPQGTLVKESDASWLTTGVGPWRNTSTRLELRGGDLYSIRAGTKAYRMDRVVNVWRIWLAELFSRD